LIESRTIHSYIHLIYVYKNQVLNAVVGARFHERNEAASAANANANANTFVNAGADADAAAVANAVEDSHAGEYLSWRTSFRLAAWDGQQGTLIHFHFFFV
jgi:hypothetical protein